MPLKEQLLLAREQLLKLGMTPKDLKIIAHELSHECDKSSPIQCCGEKRCESCQILHLHQMHKDKISTWMRFHQSSRIITANNFTDREQQKIETEMLKKEEYLKERKRVLLQKAERVTEELSLEEMERTVALLQSRLKRKEK